MALLWKVAVRELAKVFTGSVVISAGGIFFNVEVAEVDLLAPCLDAGKPFAAVGAVEVDAIT